MNNPEATKEYKQNNIIEEDIVEEDQDEYEYITPHYTRNAILLLVLSMLVGAGFIFILSKDSLYASVKQQYLDQGYILTDNATATAADIAYGKTAYVNGVKITGTYIEVDTSSATATAADILKGYTAYVDGVRITGAIGSFIPNGSYIPGRNTIIVSKKGFYLSEPVVIQGDADLISKNIRAGVTIFGVRGTYSGE